MFTLIVCALLLTVTTGVVEGSADSPQIPDGIKIHKVIRTWEKADLQCKTEGAVLASPITPELLHAMKSVISLNDTPYFIGTKLNENSESFVSVEGVPLDNMTDAVMKMIKQLDPYDGECLSMDQNNIRVVPCCERLPFMCYKAQTDNSNFTTAETQPSTVTRKTKHERTTETTITDIHRTMCGADVEGYKYFEATGSCYKLHEDKHTWNDSAATCLVEGSYLAVIDNVAEARIITNEMGIYQTHPFTYIGLYDHTGENDWRSVTGKKIGKIYDDWYAGGPTGWDSLCGIILPSGKIDNYPCHYESYFICEKPAIKKELDIV